MKPRLIVWGDGWLCIGTTVIARGNTMQAAYQRWYQLRCIEG